MHDCYWRAWEGHCRLFPLNKRGPNLPPHNIEDMLLTFAVAVRKASMASEVKSRFSLSRSRSELLPKSMFWTDIVTPGTHPPPTINSLSAKSILVGDKLVAKYSISMGG